MEGMLAKLAALEKHVGATEEELPSMAYERGRADELARIVVALRSVLSQHWLAGIDCDHEAETDTPRCACSTVAFAAEPNIGMAVEAWIVHVASVLVKTTAPAVTPGPS